MAAEYGKPTLYIVDETAKPRKNVNGPSDDALQPTYPAYSNTQMPTAGPPPYTAYPHPPQGPVIVQPQPGPVIVHPQPGPYYQTNLGTTVLPGAVVMQNVGPGPSRTVCRACNQEVVTRVENTATMRTHLLAAMLCILGCWPCVFLPYCMEPCLNTDHYCTNCGSYVGSYIR